MNELVSKKFILSVLVISLSFALVVMKMLDAQVWLALALGVSGIYSYANIQSQKIDSKAPDSTVVPSK